MATSNSASSLASETELPTANPEPRRPASENAGVPRFNTRRTWSAGLVVAAVLGLSCAGYRFRNVLAGIVLPAGNREAAASNDWCEAHSVPESICIACDAALAPAGGEHGWCAEHGVAECLLEHPELAQLKTPYLPDREESERIARALALRPRAENNALCKLHLTRIQFASDESLAKAGVDIAIVARRPVTETIAGNGELVYDQTSVAHLSSRASGTVVFVQKQVGDTVAAGEVLALVDSTEVGQAKATLLEQLAQRRLATATVERLRPIAADGTVPARQLREAEAALETADARLLASHQALTNLGIDVALDELEPLSTREIADRLRFWGIPAELPSALRGAAVAVIGQSSNLFALRAPLAGAIVEREIVVGEVVDSSKLLFTLADPTRMWLMLNVRQEDADYVHLGQEVRFSLSDDHQARPLADPASARSNDVTGRVAWVNTSADEQTRTVEVRVALANPEGRLRANTFGSGRIVLRHDPQSLVIPSEALHWDGDCHVVFVRDKHWFEPGAPQFFHVRKVRVGVREPELTEILAGLAPGEVVASKNSVVLEAQLLKSKLGDGCGCAH